MKLRLIIEPRPIATWGITLSNRLPKKEWDEIRRKTYRDANYKCEICEDERSKLFCHEIWVFDDRRKIQRLAGLECCCKLCSDVHHLGRSTQVYSKDYVEKLIEHWCKVNKRTREDFLRYEAEIREVNRRRADKQYIVKVGRRILA